MGHSIAGFVAKYADIIHWAAFRPGMVVAPLAQGFGLALDEDKDYGFITGPRPEDREICNVLAEQFPLAFVATEYFGGKGEQSAEAWTGTHHVPFAQGRDGLINSALRHIGVERTADADEFDTLGLGWYRSNDDWIAFARRGKADWERQARLPAAQAYVAATTA